MANAVQSSEEVLDRRKLEQPISKLPSLEHLGFENNPAVLIRKHKALADCHLAAGTNERVPAILASWFGQHHFDAASGLFLLTAQRSTGVEPRWDHPAVIQHQQISGSQQGREFVELAVL